MSCSRNCGISAWTSTATGGTALRGRAVRRVAGPIVDKLELSDMTVDWVWICVLALWQRW
jgi:hypothetical protein